MNNPDLPARRQRRAAHILVAILREHSHLPVLTWSVAPDHLHGHADLCDVESGHDRSVFTAWADALTPTGYPDPEPVLDAWGISHLRANRNVAGLSVILTATVHPF